MALKIGILNRNRLDKILDEFVKRILANNSSMSRNNERPSSYKIGS